MRAYNSTREREAESVRRRLWLHGEARSKLQRALHSTHTAAGSGLSATRLVPRALAQTPNGTHAY